MFAPSILHHQQSVQKIRFGFLKFGHITLKSVSSLVTTLRNSGLLGHPGQERGGGVGGGGGGGVGVELQSREHWAVSAGQLTDFGFQVFLGL